MATIGQGILRAGQSIGAGFARAGQRQRLQEQESSRRQAIIDAAALERTQKLEDQKRLAGNVEQVIRQKLGMPTNQTETPVTTEALDETDEPTKVNQVTQTGKPQVIAGIGFTPGMAKPFAKILAQNPQAFSGLISFLKTADNQKLAATAKTTEQNLQMGTLLSRAKNKDQMDFMIKNIIETKPNLSKPQREQLLRIQNDPDFENRKLRLGRVISENQSTKDLLIEHNKVRAEGKALDISETKRGRDAVLGVLTTVQNQTDPNIQVQMLEQGVADLKAEGLDARPLERIVSHPQRTLRLPNLISGTIGAFQPAGVTTAQLKPVSAGGDRFATSPTVTIENPDGSISIGVPVTDKGTGESKLNLVSVPGDIIDKKFGETAEAFQKRKVDTVQQSEIVKLGAQTEAVAEIAKREVQARGAAKRVQSNINTGLERAALIPVINRSLELMQIVKTGGFAAAKLRGKQLLGIESADEAELFFNLQKSIVSQLKKTFGAAFTKQEGDLLGRIEANFGKSTAGNIRLLNQTIKFLMIDVNRGLRSAKGAGDKEAILEIQDLLSLSLAPDPEGAAPTTQTQGTAPATEQTQRNVTVDF